MRAVCILLAAAGCKVASPPVAAAPAVGATMENVLAAQAETFRELAAADARFARRASAMPTRVDLARAMQASVAAEEPAGLLSGAPDPLTRAPRQKALEAATARIAGLAPTAPDARGALALLRAVIREERARFTREAKLPDASVRLIHALAAAPPPLSNEERAQNDAVLTRRLGEIEDSLDAADSLDGDSIEDALDQLEPQVTSIYPEATKALTSLRLASSLDLPPPSGTRAIPVLAVALPIGTKAAWVAHRERIRTELLQWQSAADSVRASDREREATELVLGRSPCGATPSPLAPPPERTFGCSALARGAEEPLLLTLVVHDLLTLGLWAIELSEERSNYRRVLSQYAMAGRVPADVGGKLARNVAAAPEAALRAGQLGGELAALPKAARPKWIRDYLARGAFLPAELVP